MGYLLWLEGRSQRRIYPGPAEFPPRLESDPSGTDLFVRLRAQRKIQFDLHFTDSAETCSMTSEGRQRKH